MSRFLHFVRHGQYSTDTGSLTALGRKQAVRVAYELKRQSPIALHVSDVTRALETADIVASHLNLNPQQCHLLREALPTRVPRIRIPLARRAEDTARLAELEQRFFRRAQQEVHEAFICHGNLIRALVARALGAPSTHWLRMHIHHAGITTFVVGDDDAVRLVSFNTVAHVAPTQRTSS